MHSESMERFRNAITPYLLFLPLCYGVFIAADDLTVVVTILPDIMQSLKVPINDIDRASWLITAFLIGYAATMPIMGRLSDRWGYRRAFWIALILFMIGSACVAATEAISALFDSVSFIDSFRWMIFARVVQALGAGAVIPIAIAAAESLVGKKRRVIAYGMVGASAQVGAVFGPVWAGIVTQWIGWQWTFWFNIPLSIVAMVLLLGVPEGKYHDARIDWRWLAIFVTAITAMTIGLFRVTQLDVTMVVAFAIAAVAGTMMVRRIIKSRMASITGYLFRVEEFVWANIAQVFIGAGLMIGLVSVPLLAGTVYHLSAFEAGMLMMRVTIPMGIAAIIGGLIATEHGARLPTAAGLLIAPTGYTLMTFWGLEINEPRASIELALVGFGFGLIIAPITESALLRVMEQHRGIASGILTLSRTIGMMFGLAVVASLGAQRFLTNAPDINQMIENPSAADQAGLDTFATFFRVASWACAFGFFFAYQITTKYRWRTKY